MKNIDVLRYSVALNGVERQGIKPVDFSTVKNITISYAKHKNCAKLLAEVETIHKVIEEMKPTRYSELQAELQEAVKVEVDKAKADNEKLTDDQANEIADKVVKAHEKYSEWLTLSKEYQVIIDDVYNQESSIELHKVKLSAIPDDLLTDEQFQAISGFVEE